MPPETVLDNRKREKVLLVAIEYKSAQKHISAEEIAEELKELVLACQGEVVDQIICRLQKSTAVYLISEGKVQEIADACQKQQVDTVCFSHELKGSQQRNLEERIKVKVIDRTQLILDIFARRAKSLEGKMQVELAQLEYLKPRLVGHGVELSRLGGGIGTSGPGETKLEMDRRRISERIDRLKADLKSVTRERATKRKKRTEKGVPTVSLVGYTNAGKTTLLNALAQSEEVTKDGLFTTLDPVSRQMVLPNHQKVIISDTVGFMRELPHHLIESFKATLEEVGESDLLLHVLDVSHPDFLQLYESVNTVLRELKAERKPTIMVLNKIDKIADQHLVQKIKKNFDCAVCISAKEKLHLDKLQEEVLRMLSFMFVEIHVDIPINRMDLVNLAHQEGEVFSIKYYNDSINIRASVPAHIAEKFK